MIFIQLIHNYISGKSSYDMIHLLVWTYLYKTCILHLQYKTNNAHPCFSTAIDNDSLTTSKIFWLHISLPEHEENFEFLNGSPLDKSDIFADITVSSGLKLNKARKISPGQTKEMSIIYIEETISNKVILSFIIHIVSD